MSNTIPLRPLSKLMTREGGLQGLLGAVNFFLPPPFLSSGSSFAVCSRNYIFIDFRFGKLVSPFIEEANK
jgi:hypothetical protein